MADPDLARVLDAQGFVVAPPRSPEETAAQIRDHTAKWAEVIRAGNIRPE